MRTKGLSVPTRPVAIPLNDRPSDRAALNNVRANIVSENGNKFGAAEIKVGSGLGLRPLDEHAGYDRHSANIRRNRRIACVASQRASEWNSSVGHEWLLLRLLISLTE